MPSCLPRDSRGEEVDGVTLIIFHISTCTGTISTVAQILSTLFSSDYGYDRRRKVGGLFTLRLSSPGVLFIFGILLNDKLSL